MIDMFTGLSFAMGLSLFFAVLFVLAYEFINGFHDTANAVATVIYTKAMSPHMAVVASGIFNFLGVILGGLGVAYAIVHLLPVDMLLNITSVHGMVLVFSLLTAAIVWNLGTWYFGIPASSSHTLIGSLLGVCLANALITDIPISEGVNVKKAIDIMLSLLISPLVGFGVAALVLLLLKKIFTGPKIHKTPQEREQIDGKKHPPFWTRVTLVASAMGVSFVHGSNDGQKGIGLIMLVLIGLTPAQFVLNLDSSTYQIERTRDAATHLRNFYNANENNLNGLVDFTKKEGEVVADSFKCNGKESLVVINTLESQLKGVNHYSDLNLEQRRSVRRLLLCIDDTAKKVSKLDTISDKKKGDLKNLRKDLTATTEYAPMWVIITVALALGLGTMMGWKRIVYTVGEKIGKSGMTYSQGMSAQITAATAIGVASVTGMPVSTTHVLSSAVAGTMVANRTGLQFSTVRTILLAWLFTLPATILLSGGLFYIGTLFI
ncbi:inorganic phosphate transporter [Cellvibrio fibrivorans]|uniref:Phosphate transporter n=1 Tax=Cellvibrio fibrivorans TaxID=126350 RepID=A0ABU1UV13_9GAMM|nr:inorganic phosphate transporter [Cellvibrio fibrivorans]MDR7089039.1 low-affinity inorganic phosphate transporter [Cellvibrio fibrivorans]